MEEKILQKAYEIYALPIHTMTFDECLDCAVDFLSGVTSDPSVFTIQDLFQMMEENHGEV